MFDVTKRFSDQNGFSLHAFRTPFPVTFFNYTDRYKDTGNFVNDKIIQAHAVIEKGSKSPYLVWAEILGYAEKDLPDLLNMTEASCKRLVLNPHQSPPTTNVQHFCDKIGIHPAYLLSNMTSAKSVCHYSVLRAVAHVYKDKLLPQHERDIAKTCLSIEKDKFIELRSQNHYAYFNLFQAQRLMASLMNNAEASERLSIAPLLEEIRIKPSFNGVSRNPASDIDLGLDLWRIKKSRNVDDAFLDIEKEDRKRMQKAINRRYKPLLEVAKLMFGPDSAKIVVDETIEKILHFESRDPELEWEFSRNGIWFAKNKSQTSSFSMEHLYKANEYNPAEVDAEFENLRKHYKSGIIGIVDILQSQAHKKENAVELEKELGRFDEWRKSPEAVNRHIPLLANFALAERVLGQQFLLAPPEADYADTPTKRRRHTYEHSYK